MLAVAGSNISVSLQNSSIGVFRRGCTDSWLATPFSLRDSLAYSSREMNPGTQRVVPWISRLFHHFYHVPFSFFFLNVGPEKAIVHSSEIRNLATVKFSARPPFTFTHHRLSGHDEASAGSQESGYPNVFQCTKCTVSSDVGGSISATNQRIACHQS
jgi:hypothetical protein